MLSRREFLKVASVVPVMGFGLTASTKTIASEPTVKPKFKIGHFAQALDTGELFRIGEITYFNFEDLNNNKNKKSALLIWDFAMTKGFWAKSCRPVNFEVGTMVTFERDALITKCSDKKWAEEFYEKHKDLYFTIDNLWSTFKPNVYCVKLHQSADNRFFWHSDFLIPRI